MIEWLMTSVDISRPHDVGFLMAWHGRIMVLVWAILMPLVILATRFFKIWPRQNWPEELDDQKWWYLHLTIATMAICLTICAAYMAYIDIENLDFIWHRIAGYSVVFLITIQYVSGFLRGTKGGPTEPELRGDHFDMTRHRIAFEAFHKICGYGIIILSIGTIFGGIYAANGPRWMMMILVIWYICLASLFVILQRKGYAVDTYQAIWGSDPSLPGNKRIK